MSSPTRSASRYQSLRTSRLVLLRSAPLVRFLLFGAGLSLFLDQVRPLISDAQFTWGERRVMGVVALFTVGTFGLAGWLVGRLLRASAELIDVFIDGAEAASRTADLMELQMVPALGRIAAALEKTPAPVVIADRAKALDDLREAMAQGRWGHADRIVEAYERAHPNSRERTALADELAKTRRSVINELRVRLDNARSREDAEAIIDVRDELTQHLRGEQLADLDQEVVRWLLSLIQRRVRAGDVRTSLAQLAARVVESFGDTAEAASLRAALPNLRRSAGLCPRCGRPHKGSADICPQCAGNGSGTAKPASRGTPLPKDQS